MGYTTASSFENAYSTLHATFAAGRTKDLRWRKWQLKQCWWMVSENEEAIISAIYSDLHRPTFETYAVDLLAIKTDILDGIKNLEKWTADVPVNGAGFIFGTLGGAKVHREPLGVALIIGAWNFPIALALQPLFAAITAGCCAIVKPSELAPATEKLLVELIPKYLDQDAVRVVTGGPADTARILERRFNVIFYTGSSKVGKIVAAAAAKTLTPTVLELGGQNPAIVTASADVDLAAKRIASSKYLNAGQICLSTNHVFVDPSIHDVFVERVRLWFDKFMSGGVDNFTRIINENNHKRLMKQLEATKGNVVYKGKNDQSDKLLYPTVVTEVKLSDSLLEDEIFGPILPIIKADLATTLKSINSMEHPLGLYVFSGSKAEINHIQQSTTSGGLTINDCMLHAAVPNAPFGGVGNSGQGSYHGEHGVLAFSHQRTVLQLPNWVDKLMGSRYPPYDLGKREVVKNTLGFKKGEGLGDQKIGGVWWFW